MTTELTNAVDALNDVTQKHEQLNEKYQGTHDALASNSKAMADWQTQQGTVELTDQHGNKHPTPTLKTLVEQAQSVNPHPHAMTKAQFDALRDMRKHQYAGSGFVEWGKHRGHGNSYAEIIGEGFWARTRSDANNSLKLGYRAISDHGFRGTSRTIEPLVLVDGTFLKISSTPTNSSSTIDGTTDIDLPQAPDGTKTYDSATGTVTQHTNAEVAFASETATNKVITSRKDLVFLESWHEKIADKDVVYPLGNVQYGASSYEGVTLLNNLVAQGYSAFGEWDESTQGYGVKWSSLTDAQKALFLSEPEHNIYFDPKANVYIQVRYRIRVVEGLGDDWLNAGKRQNTGLRYTEVNRVRPQGKKIASIDYQYGSGFYEHINPSTSNNIGSFGILHSVTDTTDEKGSHCAVPIALVQRLNQGAYHPTYNPMGCNTFAQSGLGYVVKWSSVTSDNINSILNCFVDFVSGNAGRSEWSGNISTDITGRSDQYKYHDAIYAGQVEDLRLNANKLDVNKLREDAMRKAVAGEMRGKGKVLFTQFKTLNQGYYRSSNQYHASFFNSATDGQLLEMHENEYAAGTPVMVWQPATNTVLYGRISNSNGHMALTQNLSNRGNNLHTHALNSTGLVSTEVCYFAQVTYLTPEFDSLPWVDIIGDPERIAATFPDGVIGQWVPQVPLDDISQPFIFNRKSVQGNYSRIFTIDDGASWTKNTHTIQETLNRTDATFPDSRYVSLLHYETHSNFTEPSANSVVVGDVGDVRFNSEYRIQRGNRLQHSLIGEIGKDSNVPYGNFKLTENLILDDGLLFGTANNGGGPLHNPIESKVPSGNEGNSGVKALSTITEKNGLYYLQLHGAELKHTQITQADMTVITAGSATGPITKGKVYLFKGYDNALINRPIIAIADHASLTWHANVFDGYIINSIGQILGRLGNVNPLLRAFESRWGDDQTIPIIDGENVKTDLNGNTVKVFCHHTQIPLGIAHND